MVKLGDYVGMILSEMTRARAQADVETLKLAELYASNKTLRHFAVPRVRLQNVEITTPLMINKQDESALEEYNRPVKISEVRALVDSAIAANLERNNLKLSAADTSAVKKSIDERSDAVARRFAATRAQPAAGRAQPEEMISLTDTKNIADEYVDQVDTSLKRLKATQPAYKNIDVDKISAEVKADLRAKIANLRPLPPRLEVLVNTAQIKETATKELVTYVKFTITEDSMEWCEYQSSTGEVKEQLVPE
jgi:hypothetical protein